MTRTTLLKKLALVGASLFILFICAEVILRLQRRFNERQGNEQTRATGKIHDHFYYDADGCFRIVPNSVGIHRPYEGKTPVTITINSHGFRGPEPESNSAARCVFVGDSIVFDGGVPDEKMFVRLVEDKLNSTLPDRERPAECLNLGTTDTGVFEYLPKVQHHALSLKPNILVLGFYLNDARPPQGFLGEDGYSGAERGLVQSQLYGLLTVQELHHLYRTVKFTRNKLLSRRFRWAVRFKSRNWISDQQECDRLIDEADYDWGAAWVESTWDSVEEGLRAIADSCREKHVLPVIVCFPASPQVEVDEPYRRLYLPQE